VVQSRDIHGDVHIHTPDQPKPPPFQVPLPTRHYTNNERQLGEISDAVVAHHVASGADTPKVVVIQGPPGGGKSETAYQWLDDHRGDYPDGQFYASLGAKSRHRDLASFRRYANPSIEYARRQVEEAKRCSRGSAR
jgi:hypothetical protein